MSAIRVWTNTVINGQHLTLEVEHTGDLRVTEGGALLIVDRSRLTNQIVAAYAPTAWTRVVVSEP